MRFGNSSMRIAITGAAAVLAAGCALVAGPETPSGKPAQTAAPAQNTATAPGANSPTEASVPVEAEAPLSPTVQRDFELGRRALIAGQLDEAERYFLALTKANPELGGPHANLGIVYRQRKRLDDSVAELERAVQINPKQAVYFNQLGISYRMVGQFKKARDAYEKAIALDPNYALAHLNLGILFDVYLWDGPRALELYDRYLSLSPGGDDRVKKWATDLRNRNQPRSLAARKEQG
jgi:tetratricopeptide (TPR) repeat protein